MTSTAVVLGIATLGRPDGAADCDCATAATGSIAMRKGIMGFIGSPLGPVWYFVPLLRVRSSSLRTKKLPSRAVLATNVPRLHQHLRTPFGAQAHPDPRQHSTRTT